MSSGELAIAALAAVTSVLCAIIDARTGLIPNRVTYPALLATLALAAANNSALAALGGAACAAASLLALRAVTRGRGLGMGDVKLGACIGAGLGAQSALLALAAAFIAGGAVATLLLCTQRASRGDRISFGPFMALGTAIAFALRWSAAR